MDLAKESNPYFKINKKLIALILYLPGLWLTTHVFIQGLHISAGFTSRELWNIESNKSLVEEFKTYRDNFYLIYMTVFIIFGIYILITGFKRIISGKTEFKSESVFQHLIPGAILGIIFVTFSYALAGVLLDLYQTLIKFI